MFSSQVKKIHLFIYTMLVALLHSFKLNDRIIKSIQNHCSFYYSNWWDKPFTSILETFSLSLNGLWGIAFICYGFIMTKQFWMSTNRLSTGRKCLMNPLNCVSRTWLIVWVYKHHRWFIDFITILSVFCTSGTSEYNVIVICLATSIPWLHPYMLIRLITSRRFIINPTFRLPGINRRTNYVHFRLRATSYRFQNRFVKDDPIFE